MIQELLSKYFYPSEKKTNEIMDDIELFYQYIVHNREAIDKWHFSSVFNECYSKYLTEQKRLTSEEQNYLFNGILTILFFKIIIVSGKDKYPYPKELQQINRRLNKFRTNNLLTRKLLNITKSAVESYKNSPTEKDRDNMNQTVVWVIKNFAKTKKPLIIKIKR